MSAPDKALTARLAGVDRHALEQMIDFGPGYFNPLLGQTVAETFDNLEGAMQFLHEILDGNMSLGESRRGLALFVQTVWVACQYEAHRKMPAD